MFSLFKELNNNYLDRTQNLNLQKKAWVSLAREYPPNLANYNNQIDFFKHPSLSLASEIGDLGLALLWIVQTVLVRSFLKEISPEFIAQNKLEENLIGSLAHSESKNKPFTVFKNKNNLVLSGQKKYITGGLTSDFILLTARSSQESKVNSIILLLTSDLPKEALEEISLKGFKTTSHARLFLKSFTLSTNQLIVIDPRLLRKSLKKWGIIEKSMILEAYLGLFLYLAERIDYKGKNLKAIKDILEIETKILQEQLEIEKEGGMIPVQFIQFDKILPQILSLVETIGKDYSSYLEKQQLQADDFIFMTNIFKSKLVGQN